MASLARSTLLRSGTISIAPRHSFTTAARSLQTFRPASSILTKPIISQRSPSIGQIAAFHSSVRRNILPVGPQILSGGVNDAAPIPKSSPVHGSYHWTAERLVALGLVPLTIVPFAAGSMSPTLDAIFVATIIIHSHIGFQSCVIDYFPRPKYATLRRVMDWLLNIITVAVAVGFYEFETNDVGVTETIKRIWHAGENDATVEAADIGRLGHDGKLKHLTK